MADNLPEPGKLPAGAGAPRRALRSRIEIRDSSLPIEATLRQRLVDRFRREIRECLPWLGVSFLIHAIVTIPLAVFVVSVQREQIVNPIEVGWATEAPAKTNEPPTTAVIAAPSLQDQMRAAAREAATAAVSPGPGPQAKPAVSPADVSGSLGGRLSDSARAGAAGQPKDELRQALDRALAWIVRQQQPDGRWKMTGPYSEAAESREADTDSGATALALLALLGDGNTPTRGTHQKAVSRGVDWLVGRQKANGDLFDAEEEGRSAHFYAHSQATMVLCEVLALSRLQGETPPPAVQTAAEKAVKFLIDAQNPRMGGWKYRPLDVDGIGDLSVTGWALMALHTARMADIEVPHETYLLASAFLDSTQVEIADGASYRYRPDEPQQPEQAKSMTAEGLLCRQWLGWPHTMEEFERGSLFLTSEVNRPVWEEGQRNVYAWYYTAQMLHNLGGERWKKWFDSVQKLIVGRQSIGSGQTGGSWNPVKPRGAFLEWSEGAGRLYFTVMCVLILETPYRHAPIYKSDQN